MFDFYPDILTVNDVTEILGISKNMVYKLIKAKKLPAERLGSKLWRISKKELIKYFESKMQNK